MSCSQNGAQEHVRRIDSASPAVTVPGTVHELGSEAAKARKHPGTNGTNAEKAGGAFDNAEERGIDGYTNQHTGMGGIDITNQLKAIVALNLPHFVHADTMVTNTYSIFQDPSFDAQGV